MNNKFDVIVIGAGPAGSSAAYTLSQAGMDVALLDKKVFPREKLCGGLLSGRSKKIFLDIFKAPWEPPIEFVSHGVNFYYKEKYLNGISDYHQPIYFTSRANYDSYLIKLAEMIGVKVFQGFQVISINKENCSVLCKNGHVLQSDFIIGADGITSRTVKSIFQKSLNKDKLALGLEIEVPIDLIKNKVEVPEIYFGIVNWGYGWIFPKKKSFTVGVGALYNQNNDIKLKFDRFLKQTCLKLPTYQLKGHFLPFGSYMKYPGVKNILIVGDAAGLVEPITGEGIAFAMLSGKLAAESIVEASKLNNPSLAFHFYSNKYKQITEQLDSANFLRSFIFSKIPQQLFVNILPKTRSLIKNHMDLLADEISYKEYNSLLFKKAGTGIFKYFAR